MKKEIFKLQDINLPINELELSDDELIVIRGGKVPPGSGSNCNCDCSSGDVAGDGTNCNCTCNGPA